MNNTSANHKSFHIPNKVTVATTLLFLFLIACSNEEGKLVEAAKDLFDQKDYKGAIAKYEQFISNFPDSRLVQVALFNIGAAHYNLKNYREARYKLRDFLKRDPNPHLKSQARLWIAESLRHEKEYNQAYIAYDSLTSKEFDDFPQVQEEAMYLAAHCLQQRNVYDEALGRYTQFLLRFPHSQHVSDAYFDIGAIFASHKKEYEIARRFYNRALELAENLNRKAEIQLYIGESYYEQEYYEKALTAFKLLLQEYEESNYALRARTFIAHIHGIGKEWDEAINAYETIFANHRNDETDIDIRVKQGAENVGAPIRVNRIALSYNEFGEVFYEQNDFKNAFTSFARILTKPKNEEMDYRRDPIAPYTMYQAMQSLIKLSEGGEFAADVKSALHGIFDTSPEEPLPSEINELLAGFVTKYISDVLDLNARLKDDDAKLENTILSAKTQLGYANVQRQELKRYDAAIMEYEKIIEAYPPLPDPRLDLIKLKAHYYKGLCYDELSRPDDAVKAYLEAITLFNTVFQPFFDFQNINAPRINKETLDYCVKTALDYAEKACEKLKDTEHDKKACKKVKAARRVMRNSVKKPDSANALESRDRSRQSKARAQLTPEEIAEVARESTVVMTMRDANGEEEGKATGFFVRTDLIATNYHVVEGAIEGTARLVGGGELSYTIVGYTAVDAIKDLAILKVRAFGVKHLPLGDGDKIRINQDIYAVGNPLGRPYLEGTVSHGNISGVREDPTRKWVQITAPITHGNSGGPVLNNKGEVIGVSTIVDLDDEATIRYDVKDTETKKKVGVVDLPRRREQNLNFAVHVDELKALLKRIGPPKPLSDLEAG